MRPFGLNRVERADPFLVTLLENACGEHTVASLIVSVITSLGAQVPQRRGSPSPRANFTSGEEVQGSGMLGASGPPSGRHSRAWMRVRAAGPGRLLLDRRRLLDGECAAATPVRDGHTRRRGLPSGDRPRDDPTQPAFATLPATTVRTRSRDDDDFEASIRPVPAPDQRTPTPKPVRWSLESAASGG